MTKIGNTYVNAKEICYISIRDTRADTETQKYTVSVVFPNNQRIEIQVSWSELFDVENQLERRFL